ncbi:glycosyltransferase family 39 protein [Kitasatospora paranensis]|uniref:Glycosyltransferase family 39 protein n=1 Tax=Kitasatospora paranensis TaxID=258053 RepID=A0ABW2G6R3_9ACTN
MTVLRSRAPLLGVLLLQAVLTLALSNSARPDEATYLYGGHRLLDDFLDHRPLDDNYDTYFGGLPYLYPVIAAGIDGLGGLAAVRALSLLCMLTATWLVGATARRLFDERAGFFAAAVFGLSAPVLFTGNLATFDAASAALIAAALCCAVQPGDGAPGPAGGPDGDGGAATRAPVLAFFAVALKYATWAFVLPVIAVEAVLTAADSGRREALRRAALFLLWVAAPALGVLFLTAWYTGNGILKGILGAAGDAGGGQTTAQITAWSVDCAGVVLLLAAAGAVLHALTDDPVHRRSKPVRTALGAVLCAGALIAPLTALWLRSAASLAADCGLGLVLAAPMAGWLLARLSHGRARSAVLAVATLALAATSAAWVSQQLFARWPDSRPVMAYLRPAADTGGTGSGTGQRILAETAALPRYYLYPDAARAEILSTSAALPYTTTTGRRLTGEAAFRQAIADRRFDRIVLDSTRSPEQSRRLTALLAPNGYRLVRTFAFRDTAYSSVPFHFPRTRGHVTVWQRS